MININKVLFKSKTKVTTHKLVQIWGFAPIVSGGRIFIMTIKEATTLPSLFYCMGFKRKYWNNDRDEDRKCPKCGKRVTIHGNARLRIKNSKHNPE
ncbi:hypothetical protein ACJMK2_010872 [Sinanodonta woodiana]|uniref:Uncharacterized protein n=1 Tax=Sinanodonta woodiana TaxID=1069815 RepID=A0ABD3VH66_SINWO